MSDRISPDQLVGDYSRSVREAHLAFSDQAKAAANARRSILAGLVITDHRVDMSMRVKVATAESKAVGNNNPMRLLRTGALAA
jgi:hypothetical protein